jgi:glycerophosphoryl diester phosphodiesterase
MNQNKTCKIISHRGLNKISPNSRRKGENTLEAFEAGVKMLEELERPKEVEFDIRLTKDGVPVVIHNLSVDGTANKRKFVSNYSLSSIEKFDMGYGRKIPTLSETLEFFKNKNIFLNIELKEKNTANLVAEMVYKYNLQKRVMLSASDEDDPDKQFYPRRYCPSWADLFSLRMKLPIALLVSDKKIKKMGINNVIEIAKKNNVYAINPEDISVNKKLVELSHRAGLKVNVWTVNTPKVYKRLLEYGVDGVFCDNPSFLMKN